MQISGSELATMESIETACALSFVYMWESYYCNMLMWCGIIIFMKWEFSCYVIVVIHGKPSPTTDGHTQQFFTVSISQ